jgi:hypothetical protein
MSRNLAAVSRRSAGAAGGQMRQARGGTPKPPKMKAYFCQNGKIMLRVTR